MPAAAEKQIKRQGGTARYRTLKKGDKTMTCAITKKNGPKGGKSVCWNKETIDRVLPRPPLLEAGPEVEGGEAQEDPRIWRARDVAAKVCVKYVQILGDEAGWYGKKLPYQQYVARGFERMDKELAAPQRQQSETPNQPVNYRRNESRARQIVSSLLEAPLSRGDYQKEMARREAFQACLDYLRARGGGAGKNLNAIASEGLSFMYYTMKDDMEKRGGQEKGSQWAKNAAATAANYDPGEQPGAKPKYQARRVPPKLS